jgi:hypothetical protein
MKAFIRAHTGLKENPFIVIPAQAGIHLSAHRAVEGWIPAFAGMTV